MKSRLHEEILCAIDNWNRLADALEARRELIKKLHRQVEDGCETLGATYAKLADIRGPEIPKLPDHPAIEE